MQRNHTSLMQQRLYLGLTVAFAVAALAAFFASARFGAGIEAPDTQKAPSAGRSHAYYARYVETALGNGDLENAHAAALLETRAAPKSFRSWHRRALTAAELNGSPDQEALRSLIHAYELAPYPGPADMAWRVDFAAAYWPYMPDVVQELTLGQIEVLGEIPKSWDRRRQWCKTLPDSALAEAACATTPGVWRGGVRQGPGS